jgi:hypothetical protein
VQVQVQGSVGVGASAEQRGDDANIVVVLLLIALSAIRVGRRGGMSVQPCTHSDVVVDVAFVAGVGHEGCRGSCLCPVVSGGGGVGGLLGGGPCFPSCWGLPSLLPSLLSLLFLFSLFTSSFRGVLAWGGGEVVVVVVVAGQVAVLTKNSLVQHGRGHLATTICCCRYCGGQDRFIGRRTPARSRWWAQALTASSNTEKQTKFTNCEFKFEIRRRLSSLSDNPSRRRYFSSLRGKI